MQFNEGQKAVTEGLDRWERDFREPFFILSGVSGSGKSTCVSYFLKKLQNSGKKVCLTAPTTEALESLVETIQAQGSTIEYSAMTIQSLLGYRPVTGKGDEQILVRAGGKKQEDGTYLNPPPKVVPYDYVILDEAYYNPSILTDSIFTNYTTVKWILLGDHKQLAPIGEAVSSLVFREKETKYFFDLKQDMRSIDPKQTTLVAEVRERGVATNVDQYILTKKAASQKIEIAWNECNNCPEDFSFLALAYTHKVVKNLARSMREWIYEKDFDEKYGAGELIRVSCVISDDDTDQNCSEILTRTNERVKVVQHEPDFIIVERSFGERVSLPIDHQNELETLRLTALKNNDREMMMQYHHMQRKYVNISSPWAMTAHSSQGRTKKNTLICKNNILSAQNHNLFYVAVSRSQEVPWIVKDW
jgi:predicted ATPase